MLSSKLILPVMDALLPLTSNGLNTYVFCTDTSGHRHDLRMGSPGNGGQIWKFSNTDEAAEGDKSVFFYATEFFVGTEAESQNSQATRPKMVVGA